MKRSLVRGFTLIEVMIVVAIVAILASVALPAYTDYLRRGQLPQAFTYLSDYRIKLEQYYQDNRNYGTGTCGSGGGSWNTFVPTVSPRHFTFSCSLTTAGNGNAGSGFTLTATGSGGRAVGYTYTLDQAGTKATTEFARRDAELELLGGQEERLPMSRPALSVRRGVRGVSLIEIVIVMVILGLVAVSVGPEITQQLRNLQVRNAAEAMQAGLQKARTEAISRNANVRFTLVSGLQSSCTASATGGSWIVSLDDPAGKCNQAASASVAPRIIAVHSAGRRQRHGRCRRDPRRTASTQESTIIFNSLRPAGRCQPARAHRRQQLDCAVGAPQLPARCQSDRQRADVRPQGEHHLRRSAPVPDMKTSCPASQRSAARRAPSRRCVAPSQRLRPARGAGRAADLRLRRARHRRPAGGDDQGPDRRQDCAATRRCWRRS